MTSALTPGSSMRTVPDGTMTLHDITTSRMTTAYAVYDVWLPDGASTPAAPTPPSLLFIGTCRLTAWPSMPDAHANSEFIRRVTPDTPLTVRLLATGSRLDCYRHRAALVRAALDAGTPPVCNMRGTHGRGSGIMCVEDGKTYKTQTQAAAAYGLHQSAMSNHLIGRPGYMTIGGRTFRRVAI